jgi:hypothetical protein
LPTAIWQLPTINKPNGQHNTAQVETFPQIVVITTGESDV